MRYTKLVVILSLTLLLAACLMPTPYQANGFRGGYTDSRLDSNTARVSFYGNSDTSKETVENDTLYRCAQVTLNDGYDYFVITEGGTAPIYSSFTTPGTYNATSTTTGYYVPGQTFTTRKFESSVIIKMFKGSKPTRILSAYDAREILRYVKPSS